MVSVFNEYGECERVSDYDFPINQFLCSGSGTVYTLKNGMICDDSGNSFSAYDASDIISCYEDIVVRNTVGSDNSAVEVYSPQGELIAEADISDNYQCITSRKRESGEIIYLYDSENNIICFCNTETGIISEIESVNDAIALNSSTIVYESGGVYDFYIINENKCYGYKIEDDSVTEIISNISGLDLSDITGISVLNAEGTLCAKTNDGVYLLIPDDDSHVKNTVNIAYLNVSGDINSDFKNYITGLNNSDSTAKIVTTIYQDSSKLDLDMVSGKIPDIFIFSDYSMMSKYQDKNIFLDLSALDSADESLANIFSLYSDSEKLFAVFPSFTARVLAGRTENSKQCAGIEDFLNDIFAHGSESVFEYKSKSELLLKLIPLYMAEYTDTENRNYSFNNEVYTGLLEKVNSQTYCGNDEYDKMYYYTWAKNNLAEYAFYDIADFTLPDLLYKYNDEQLSISGLTYKNKNEIQIMPNDIIAVYKDSQSVGICLDIINGLFSEEYQNSICKDSFPVNKTVYYNLLESNRESGGSDQVEIIDNLITSVTEYYRTDYIINSIIAEQAEEYFAGNITAAECAANTDKKTELYLNERY